MAEQEPKKLYRSRNNKIIAGVCAGLGKYFNVDPVWIRIIAVLLIFASGFGILAYIVMWILVPLEPGTAPKPSSVKSAPVKKSKK